MAMAYGSNPGSAQFTSKSQMFIKCSSPQSYGKSKMFTIPIWQCVKTLYPCSSHQNSWYMDVNKPLKMVFIGIDPSPFLNGIGVREPN